MGLDLNVDGRVGWDTQRMESLANAGTWSSLLDAGSAGVQSRANAPDCQAAMLHSWHAGGNPFLVRAGLAFAIHDGLNRLLRLAR